MKQRAGKRGNWNAGLVMTFLLCAALVAGAIVIRGNGITGMAAKGTANLPPDWTAESTKFVTKQNIPVLLNLGELFKDPEGQPLTFVATKTENLDVVLRDNTLAITPEPGFTGERIVTVYASDGEQVSRKRLKIEVAGREPKTEEPAPVPEEPVTQPVLPPTPEITNNTAVIQQPQQFEDEIPAQIILPLPPVREKIDPALEKALDANESATAIVILNEPITAQRAARITRRVALEERRASIKGLREGFVERIRARNITGFVATEKMPRPGVRITRTYDTVSAIAVNITKEGLESLRTDSSVREIILNRMLYITLPQSVPLIRADAMWNLTVGDQNITGKNETVCVTDTGIDFPHPAFTNKIVGGYDFVNEDPNPQDDNNHGTHCSGIVLGNTSTVMGVAPDAKVVPVKVCNSGGGCPGDDMIAGVDYCNNNSAAFNITAISMSIGDHGIYTSANCPTWIDSVLSTSVSLGIIPVIAAGNDYNGNGVNYPGCSPYAISVGSTTKSDAISAFSNYGGNRFDLFAPGGDNLGGAGEILSAIIGGGTGYMSGTSMATPHVAGVVALIQQDQRAQGKPKLSFSQMEQLLKSGIGKPTLSWFRIDVSVVIASLNENYTINLTNNSVTNASGNTTLTFKNSTDFGEFTRCGNVRHNYVEIDSVNCPQYNKSAHITFGSLPGITASPLRNGQPCSSTICQNITFANGVLNFDVTEFTSYSSTQGNVRLTKNDTDPSNASQQLDYKIIIEVLFGNASNISVTDIYPNETIYLSAQPLPEPGTNDTFIVGNLTENDMFIVNISMFVYNVTNGTRINNTANITFSNGTDILNLNVNISTLILNPPVFNFTNASVNKTENVDPDNASEYLNYTINVTITGNGTAYNVTVNDTYPQKIIYLDSQPAPVAGTNNTWILGNLTNGTSILVNITVLVMNVTNNTIITNTANVAFVNETGQTIEFVVTETTNISSDFLPDSNITVTKTDSPDPVYTSSNLTYQITVISNNNETAYNTTVNDTYPNEVIYLDAQPAPEPGTNNTWILGNLTPGTTVSVNITVLVLNFSHTIVINNTVNATFQNRTGDRLSIIATQNTTVKNITEFYNCSSCTNCTACLSGYGNTCKLTDNITSTGTCIVIDASQTTLDCDGNYIRFDTDSSATIPEQGVYAYQKEGVTIQNCNITHLNNSQNTTGILLNSTTNTRILYNNISTNLSITAIYIEQATGIIIENNTISGAFTGPALRGHTISYMNFTNNNITSPITAISVQAGNSIFSRNTFASSGLTSANAEYIGIWLASNIGAGKNSVLNNAVYENNITHTGGNGCIGIYLLGITNGPNVIDNNTISITETHEDSVGIETYGNVNSTVVSGNKIFLNSSYNNKGIYLLEAAERNTLRNNNIAVKGTSNSNWGIALTTAQTLKVAENNILNNNISVEGTTDNAGIYIRYADNNNYRFNSISASGTASYGIYINGTDSTFTSNVLNNTPTWVYSTADAANNNFVNTTFSTPRGSIWLPGSFALPAGANIAQSKLNISHNRAFVNSTALNYLNISAQIRLNDINYVSPSLLVDYADNGASIDCPASICTKSSYADNVYVFNVTGFTTYSVGGVSFTKLDSKDPINISSYLNYTLIVNVTAGNASNISLTDIYPNETIYISAQPAPEAGTNDTFIVGNLTTGQAFIVNITTIVLNVSNNTVINNSANISFQNTTGDWLTINVTENTTVEVPPINISLTKTDNPDPVRIERYLNYTVTVSIASDDPKNITLTDIYPAEVIYDSAQPEPLAGTNDTFIIGNLSAGQTVTVNISVLVRITDNGTVINNTANITYQNSTGGFLTQNATQGTTTFDPGPPYINLTGCAVINKSAALLNSIASNDTCIIINATNTYLDCAGYSIFYNANGSDREFGVFARNFNNITVKNCLIRDINATGAYGYGVNFTGITNGSILNSTIRTNGTQDNYGVSVTLGTSNIIADNTISTKGTEVRNMGVYIDRSSGTVIANNSILANGSYTNYGIHLYSSVTNSIISNNTIQTSETFSNGGDFGIKVDSIASGNNTIIANNRISTSRLGSNNYGIEFTPSYAVTNVTIENNAIFTNGGNFNYGIDLGGLLFTSKITNNTIRTGGSGSQNFGIYCYANTINITNNTIITTGVGGSNYGIYLLSSANDNIVQSNNVTATGGAQNDYGIYISDSLRNRITGNTISTNGTSANSGMYLSNADNSVVEYNSISASGTTYGNRGIYLLSSSTNNSIKNNTITTNGTTTDHGIILEGTSENNTIVNNNITTSGSGSYGLALTGQSNNNKVHANRINTSEIESFGMLLSSVLRSNITNNSVDSVSDGLYVTGSLIEHFSTNQVVNNTINGSNITYYGGAYDSPACPHNTVLTSPAEAHIDFIGCQNITLENWDAYEVIALVNTTNVTLKDIRSFKNMMGIRILNATNNIVTNTNISTNTTVSSSSYGILLQNDANNNLINNSNITTNGASSYNYGIYITTANNNTINNSKIIAQGGAGYNYGIFFENANDGIATHNTIRTGGTEYNDGIRLTNARNTSIRSNNITGRGTINYNSGIRALYSTDNTIAGNNITSDSQSSAGHAVYLITGTNNTLIENNSIVAQSYGGSGAKYGIGIEDRSTNNIIKNNNVTVSRGGSNEVIRLYNYVTNTVVRENQLIIVDTPASSQTGIRVDSDSTNNTIVYNNLTMAATNSVAIEIANRAHNNTIAFNNVSVNLSSVSSPANSIIRLYGDVKRNVIDNNTFATSDSYWIYGINLDTTPINNSFTGNTIVLKGKGNGDVLGIRLYNGINYNQFINNTISCNNSANGCMGIQIISNSFYNKFIGTTISVNGTYDNTGIYVNSNYNNFSNTTIRTNGTSYNNYGIRFPPNIHNNTFTGTNIITDGTRDNYGIYFQSGANENRFSFTNISTNNESFGIHLFGATKNLFNATLFNNTGAWITSLSTSADNNFTNTTFEMPNGSINFPFTFTVNSTTANITKTKLNITRNRAFLNSTNLTFLNTTGIITLYGLAESDPVPLVDFEDDGTYVNCLPPQCTELSYSGGVFVYNVSSFTAYSSSEGNPNVTLTKMDYPDPVNASTQLNYTVIINNTDTASAYNISLTEIYPNATIYQNAQPAPEPGTNNTFIIGNLSSGQAFIVNITVWVLNVTNGTVINNTANISFTNASNVLVNLTVTENTTVTVPEAAVFNFSNITIRKTDNPDPVNVSTNLTYQINVSVTGNGTAYNVTINDTYPAQVIYLTSQPAPVPPTNNTWILGNLTQGTNISVNITVLVLNITNNTIITNLVNVTFQNETGAELKDFAVQQTTVLNPLVLNRSNISVAKTDSPDPVSIDSQLNYTITVTSNGDATAYNVTVNDTYPNEVVYLTSQPTPTAGVNNTWILGNLSPSTIIQVNITAWVLNLTNGTVINNTVNVTFQNETSALLSAVDRENTTVENITITPTYNITNISITKTNHPDPVNASTNLTYQINVSVTGNGTAYNVTVNDTYPNEVIYLTSQPSPVPPTNNTWILGNLTQGTNISINITVLVLNITDGTIINNTANATFQNETGTLLNNSALAATTVLNPPVINVTNFTNISITKTDLPDPVNVSTNLTYQINVSVTGNGTAYNVTVNDTYPAEVIYLTSTPSPHSTTNNTWILGNLTQGTNFSINITVLVLNITDGTVINNTANATFQNETGTLLNNSALAATTVLNPPVINVTNFTNISITKTDNPDPVNVSTNLTYQINISVTGNGTAYNVTVNDTYPTQVIYLTSQPTPVPPTNNTWILGNLTQGTNTSINITVLVRNITNGTIITNNVNATFQNETSSLLSAVDTETTLVLNPLVLNRSNISITKTDSPDPVEINSNLTYSILVTSSGDATSYNVTVNDTYPAQIIYLTSQPAPVPPTNNTWILGNLSVGTAIQINITVLATNQPNGTVINNTVNATFQNETSAMLSAVDRENTTIFNPPYYNFSNASITKTDKPDPVNASSNLTYQINVSITGNETTYNVTVNDTYPAETIYLTAQPAPVPPTNNTWVLGNLTVGTNISINVTLLVLNITNGTVINNTVNTTFQNATSAVFRAGDTESTTVLNPPVFNLSNLTIRKLDNPDPVNASSNLTYQINVSVTGNGTAYNVTVNDTYPAEVIYLTSQPTPVLPANNTWLLGNLAAGTNISINITVLVRNITNGTVINNTANATFQNETSALFNYRAFAETTVLNPPVYNTSNITITKTDLPDPVNASANLTYQINVTGSGTGRAYNVTVNDTYPAEVIYLASQPTPLAGTNNSWILGNLTSGTMMSINITVLVRNITNGTVINNTANATFQNETSNILSSLAIAGTTVLNPPVYNFSNITITKEGIPDPVAPGAQLAYTINVTSTGNTNATDVLVNDTYPALVIFDSSQPNPVAGTNNTWILGNLTPGTSITINITVNVSASAPSGTVLNNTANATYLNATDALLSVIASDTTTVSVPVPPPQPGGGGGGASRGAVRALSGRFNITQQEPAETPVQQACVESWQCGEWGLCADNRQVRTCTDMNACNTRRLVPPIERECEPPAPAPEPVLPEEQPPALPPIEQPAAAKPAIDLFKAYLLPAILALIAIIVLVVIIMDIGRRKKPKEMPEEEQYVPLPEPEEKYEPQPALPEPEEEPEPVKAPVVPPKPAEPAKPVLPRPERAVPATDRRALMRIDARLAEIDKSLGRLKKTHRRLQKKVKK